MNLRYTLIWLLISAFTLCVKAQDNREPPFAFFDPGEDRTIALSFVRQEDGTGGFLASFSMQQNLKDKQVYVRIPASFQSYRIIINEFAFGSDTGSVSIAEFNITPFINEGINRLELVFNESVGSQAVYPCGFYDKAQLIIRDAIHVKDFVTTAYHEAGSGEVLLRFHLHLKSYLQGKNMVRTLQINIMDPDGEVVATENRKIDFPISYGQVTEMVFDRFMEEPRLWSMDEPNIYRTAVQISENDGSSSETVFYGFGIRRVYLADSIMILNNDTVVPKYPEPGSLHELECPGEEELGALVRKEGFNTVILSTLLPQNMIEQLGRFGVMVQMDRDLQETHAGRSLINCPSVLWIDRSGNLPK